MASFTLASLLPYLLVAGGYLARHFELASKVAAFFGLSPAPAPNAAVPPTAPLLLPNVPHVALTSHPVLSDALNAAIKQAVQDTVSGHVQSLKAELQAALSAAVQAAVADLKGKA